MEIKIFKKNLSPGEEAAFDKLIEEKTMSIATLLKKFAYDAKLLKVSVEKFDKHTAYEVEFNLSLPAKIIHAKEASHTPTKAIELAKNRMSNQIKKYMAQLRGDRDHKSIKAEEPQTVMIFQ
ncbi:MAG: HPF/RaiA family ribosome-associated protein [Candidatus Gracilibacteria bacterium]|jgi:ribosome-associated translation inhibitor RaiA